MIALAWPIAVVIVAVLCFVAFERYTKSSRAGTDDRIRYLEDGNILDRSAASELTQRVDNLERLVSDPTQGLAEQLRQVRNGARFK